MFGFFRRRRSLVRKIEQLIKTDVEAASELFSTQKHRVSSDDRDRLAELLRRRFQALEHNAYLSRALAEGSIDPTAALELLETYQQAGYVDDEQASMHRRHAVDAHRRDLLRLLTSQDKDHLDYFSLLDGYRAAGYLTAEELGDLEHLIELKLKPSLVAKRLYAEALVAVDPSLQTELLRRYLMQFQGFEDYPHAACLYLSLRIDANWRDLTKLGSAREATLRVQELNSLLHAYLPYTSDLSEYVPIAQIVESFREHAENFTPTASDDEEITEEDVNRRVVVVAHNAPVGGTYEEDRNRIVSIGRTGRIRAVSGYFVLVEHDGPDFTYSRAWGLPVLEDSNLARIPRESSLALWSQRELEFLTPRRPSPVFVHHYQKAVARFANYLDRHRQDRSQTDEE